VDENKAIRLRKLGYKLHKTCGRCKFGNLTKNTRWGSCKLHTYFHLKHQKEMPLSINASGVCDDFEVSPLDDIHGFAEFEKE